ncbi:MAG: phosphate ABC transporter substrate-binding protein [Candidatus Margulisbacteria bacterium]|nr:phosphate ABC transporter substrate-binding protein [Candidatus Margulisiibacteriota bacterium]
MFKNIGGILAVILVTISLVGCGGGNKAVQIKGSDTMVNLGQAWTEEFMKANPEISIAVTGGGSGTGIAALIAGTTDIAQASRNMEPKEIGLARKKGVEPKEIHVANDGITIVVHPSNPVGKLTIRQLSDIFTGQIKNWKEVGGKDAKIVALSRERNSGTHVFFVEHVVKLGEKKNPNEFAPSVLMMPSSQAIIEEVIGNSAAIGYVGLGYLTNKEKACAIAKSAGAAYICPSIQTVLNNSYPISRSLLFYVNGEPSGEVKTFVDFVLSPAGQEIVKKMDFVPVK